MDHTTAPAVTSALLWRTRHGIFGYSEPDDAYHAALTGWFGNVGRGISVLALVDMLQLFVQHKKVKKLRLSRKNILVVSA